MKGRRSDRVQAFGLRVQFWLALLPFIVAGLVFIAVVALFIAL